VSDPDLPALVLKAKLGDRAAFERIVSATARLVYARIVASVRDRHRAEDLTQETFIAAWKGLSSLKEPAGFVGWLLTLARNTTLDALKFDARKKRQAERTAAGEAADDLPAAGPAPGDAAEHAEAAAGAIRLLEELPEEYRDPLMMRYLAGADYQTIRGALNLSDGALRGLLNRGMALLRERMSQTQNRGPHA
jgi:RNA polymerase sigma-70 factor (ECF subfamily)